MTFIDNDKPVTDKPVVTVLIIITYNYEIYSISIVKRTDLAPWIFYSQCKDVKKNQEDAICQQIEEVSILAKLSPLVM